MGGFLLRRSINYVVLVLIATTLGYVIAAASLNPRSNYEGRNPPPPKSSVDHTLDELNLNNETPIMVRYGRWMSGVVHGDLGKTVHGKSVNAELGRRAMVSVRLLLIGSIFGAVGGVLVGVICAVKQYKVTDYVLTMLSFVLLSIPVFLLAVLLKVAALQFNNRLGTTFLFYTGEYTPGLRGDWWAHFSDRVRHLIVPSLSLILGEVAFYSRYQRSAMLDVLGSDFLRTAQAKGLPWRKALFKHGLRTALIPMATFFAYSFGLLVVGATFTEKIFGWHGVGEWFVDAVRSNDVNSVASVTMFAAIFVLLSGLLADLAYAALDPRVRIR
jgi:peptide/nickel transport system permease protein